MRSIHPWRRVADGPALILPDGCLDVIVRPDGEVVVAGPDALAREHRGDGAYTGLRFSHGLGPRLLGVEAHELTGATVPLADVVGTGTVPAGPEDLLPWARARLAAGPDDDRRTRFVFDAAVAGVPVATIAGALECSARTLHRHCRAWFGYGPQHLHRVLRLQRALAGRARGRAWAAVAADAGYVDQPHLARETRALTGRVPSALG